MKLARKINLALAAVVTAALLYFLLSNVTASSLIGTIKRISLMTLVIGLIIYVISYFVRAIRFWLLLGRKISISRLFSITAIHNMVNSTFPARTGELSFLYLVKDTRKASATEALATIISVRIFDLASVIIIFLISLLFIENIPLLIKKIIPAVCILLLISVIILACIIFLNERAKKLFLGLEIRFRRSKNRLSKLISYVSKKIKETVGDLRILKSKKLIIYTLLLSVLIWILNYTLCYILVAAMGVNIGIWSIFAVFSVLIFVGIIPLSIVGLGTTEGVWALFLISFGIDKELAISSGFGMHILLILYFLILGLYGLISIRMHKN